MDLTALGIHIHPPPSITPLTHPIKDRFARNTSFTRLRWHCHGEMGKFWKKNKHINLVGGIPTRWKWWIFPYYVSLPEGTRIKTPKHGLSTWLVVSTYPSEKWWSSSVGMMTFPIWWESHQIPWFQTTNQPLFIIINHIKSTIVYHVTHFVHHDQPY